MLKEMKDLVKNAIKENEWDPPFTDSDVNYLIGYISASFRHLAGMVPTKIEIDLMRILVKAEEEKGAGNGQKLRKLG